MNSLTERGFYIRSLDVSISNSNGFPLKSHFPGTAMGSSFVSNNQGWSVGMQMSATVTVGAMTGASGTLGLSSSFNESSGNSSQVKDFDIIPQLEGSNGIRWNSMLCNVAGATGDSGQGCVYNGPTDLKQTDIDSLVEGVPGLIGSQGADTDT